MFVMDFTLSFNLDFGISVVHFDNEHGFRMCNGFRLQFQREFKYFARGFCAYSGSRKFWYLAGPACILHWSTTGRHPQWD